jgi:hypothetical protein
MPGESQWMKRLKPFLKREIPVAVVILLGLVSVGFFFDRGNYATIDLEAIGDQKVNCQIRLNWGKASNPRPLTIYPGITNYSLYRTKVFEALQVHDLSRCGPTGRNIPVP